jgi:hypothetical protein
MPTLLIGLLPILSEILGRVIPDPEAKQKALAEILESAQKADLAQLEVNKAEAKTGSLFIAGWRPFIGWVGGIALSWHFVVKPMLMAFAGYMDEKLVTAILNAPALDENMWGLITAMLGIGGLRTFEKIKGVTK